MGKRFKRMNGESMPEFNARCNATLKAEKKQRQAERRNAKRREARKAAKVADAADVREASTLHKMEFGADDRGLSPDY